MNIKQKFTEISERLRHPKRTTALKSTRFGTSLCRIYNICQAYSFPLQILLILLYRLVLDFVYLSVISPLFKYAGLTADILPLRYLCSLVVLMAFSPFVAALNNDSRPSSVLITFINYLYFIPLTSYCGCKGTSFSFLTIAIVYWAFLLLLQFLLPTVHLKPLKLHHSNIFFTVLTLVSVIFVLFVSGRYTGFRFTLDVINVYGIRAEAASYQIPGIFRYFLSFMTIFLTVSLLYWLQKKKYLIAGIIFVVFLLYFSIAAQKSDFFFLFLILGCYAFYRSWMLQWAAGFLTAGVAATWLINRLLGMIMPMSLFVRRMMYLPAQISETYSKFFEENPLNLFRYGIMGKFSFDNIYSSTIPKIIGEFDGKGGNLNNGMLGDLFANLPFTIGILLMPLILVICFRLLDLVSKGLPQKTTVSFCAYFAISFINTSWSTVLLTHGFLLACLLLYLFPRKEDQPL